MKKRVTPNHTNGGRRHGERIGLIDGCEGFRLLHDGRAQTIVEAIGWHGDEA